MDHEPTNPNNEGDSGEGSAFSSLHTSLSQETINLSNDIILGKTTITASALTCGTDELDGCISKMKVDIGSPVIPEAAYLTPTFPRGTDEADGAIPKMRTGSAREKNQLALGLKNDPRPILATSSPKAARREAIPNKVSPESSQRKKHKRKVLTVKLDDRKGPDASNVSNELKEAELLSKARAEQLNLSSSGLDRSGEVSLNEPKVSGAADDDKTDVRSHPGSESECTDANLELVETSEGMSWWLFSA